MTSFYNRICERNQHGIPFEEAVQLLLLAFCTLDILPEDLRHEVLGRKELIETFELLERNNLLTNIPKNDGSLIPRYLPMDVLIDLFMKGHIILEPEFRSRINKYV